MLKLNKWVYVHMLLFLIMYFQLIKNRKNMGKNFAVLMKGYKSLLHDNSKKIEMEEEEEECADHSSEKVENECHF